MFEISPNLSLNPHRVGHRYYIEYSWSGYSCPEKDRWLRFCAKRCAGTDMVGRYYRSRQHAEKVIREFCASENERDASLRSGEEP